MARLDKNILQGQEVGFEYLEGTSKGIKELEWMRELGSYKEVS
jgi:hypothetical protein